MKNYFIAKPRINKSNGQINLAVCKKKSSKKVIEEMETNPKQMKFIWGDIE